MSTLRHIYNQTRLRSHAAVDASWPLLDHDLVHVEVHLGLLARVPGDVVEAEPLEGLHVPLRLVQLSFGHVLGRKHALDGVVQLAPAPLASLRPAPRVTACRRIIIIIIDIMLLRDSLKIPLKQCALFYLCKTFLLI